jgi:hypothetical protein
MNDDFSPAAGHWPHTARHEAGHAVAAIVMFQGLGRNHPSFDRVLIRPGAAGPHVNRRGIPIDCVGLVERVNSWTPRVMPLDSLRTLDPEVKSKFLTNMKIEIVVSLAGPFAQARSMGGKSRRSARWDALFGGCIPDYETAKAVIREMRAMAGRGSLRAFEGQTHDLVKSAWPAIEALADRLLEKHEIAHDEALAIASPLLPSTLC